MIASVSYNLRFCRDYSQIAETKGQHRRRNQSGPVCSLFHILLLREWTEKDAIGKRIPPHRSRSSLNVFSKRLDRQLADRRRDGRTDRRSRLYFLLRSAPFPSRFCPYAARARSTRWSNRCETFVRLHVYLCDVTHKSPRHDIELGDTFLKRTNLEILFPKECDRAPSAPSGYFSFALMLVSGMKR